MAVPTSPPLARPLRGRRGRPRGLGWIAKGQLVRRLGRDRFFAAQVGKTSDVVTVENDGEYLFFVAAEEERTPEGRQLDEIRSRVFGDWYQPKKDALTIERDETVTIPAG